MSNRFDQFRRALRSQLAFGHGVEDRAFGFLGLADLVAEGDDHLVEPRTDGRIRNARLLGDCLEAAAGQNKYLDEPLVLGRQVGEPGGGERGLDRHFAGVAGHPADGHRLLAVGALGRYWFVAHCLIMQPGDANR